MRVKGWTIFVALLLLVSGCAPKTSGNDAVYDTYVAGETVDLCELQATIVRVSYQQSVMSLLEYGNRLEPSGAGLEYLDVVLEVENIGKTDVDMRALGLSIEADTIEYVSSVFLETPDFRSLAETAIVAPGEVRRAHLVVPVEVANKPDEVLVRFGKKRVYQVVDGSLQELLQEIKLQQNIETDTAKVVVNGFEYKTELLPEDISGDYHYLKTDKPTDKFLVLDVTVTNKTAANLKLVDVLALRNINSEGLYEYIWYVENEAKNSFIAEDVLVGHTEKKYKVVTVLPKTQTVNELRGVSDGEQINIILKVN